MVYSRGRVQGSRLSGVYKLERTETTAAKQHLNTHREALQVEGVTNLGTSICGSTLRQHC